MPKRKFLEKDVIYFYLCLSCIIVSINVGAVSAAIPVISNDLKLSDIVVSRMIAFYMIPYGLGALIYAPFTRIYSYKKVLNASMIFYAISNLLCGLTNSFDNILWARIGMGVAGACITPLGLMLIGDLFEANVRGRKVGIFFGCSFIASLIGIFLTGVVHWRWLFIIPAIMGALNSLCLMLTKFDIFNKTHTASINYIKIFSQKKVRDAFIFIFLISAFFHSVDRWWGVYLTRIYGLDKLKVSLLLILAGISGFFGQQIGGYISDKKGRLAPCHIGLIGLALSMMLLFRNYNLVIISIIMISFTMFWTIGHSGISTILTDYSDNERPIIVTLNSAIRFSAGGLGFYLSSFFVKKSYNLTFFSVGLLTLLLIFLIKNIIPAETK